MSRSLRTNSDVANMTNGTNLRARFPDGTNLTLRDLPPDTTFQTLLTRFQEHSGWTLEPRVLLAGQPPTALFAFSFTPLREVVSSGSLLLVEPHADDVSARGRGRGRGQARGRGRAPASVVSSSSHSVSQVHTLAGVSRGTGRKRARVDDNDNDWQPDAHAVNDDDDDDEGEDKKPSPSGRRRVSRRRSPTNTTSGARPNEQQANGPATRSANASKAGRKGASARRAAAQRVGRAEDVESELAATAVDMGLPEIQGQLGASLVASFVRGGAQSEDQPVAKAGKAVKSHLANALQKRQTEAEGERRLSAYLSKRYEIRRIANGTQFHVRYRGISERNWTEENNGRPLLAYPKALLKAVLQEVLRAGDDKLKLVPIDMAALSMRVFWNMATLYPDGIEDGLRDLVPDADWSFLEVRQRFLSERGQRNKQNKEEMGWTSD